MVLLLLEVSTFAILYRAISPARSYQVKQQMGGVNMGKSCQFRI